MPLMSDEPNYSAMISADNPALADLELSWRTAVFSAEDGIGPMGSLHEAGDALVAVSVFGEDGMTVLGSGVMVAPGILLTATHVLDECRDQGLTPVFFTFLPTGMRAWLPIDTVTISAPSEFYADRTVTSDLSLVSCTLNSEAHADQPLMLAPMQVALPLLGERLWAMGFCHQQIAENSTALTPFVSSGVVTTAYPNGRGERMPAPHFEVDMETYGGMSGGAVVNADGFLVGIVSSSYDGAPSYITLIWDALRLTVKGAIPALSVQERVSLFGAKARNLAKIKGDVRRNPFGEVTISMSEAEGELLTASVPASKGEQSRTAALDADHLQTFVDDWGSDMEDAAAEAVITMLNHWPVAKARDFLDISGAPAHCLEAFTRFSIEDFEGVEDFEITFTERYANGLRIEFHFEMRMLIWTIEVATTNYQADPDTFAAHFHNIIIDGDRTSMDLVQRCYFKARMVFDPESKTFGDVVLISSAVRPPRARA